MDELVENFVNSHDFMKLGQAITHKNWQVAMMSVTRLQKAAEAAGLTQFDRNFKGIRQCIIAHDGKQGLDILTQAVAKRVQLMQQYMD